MAKSDLQVGRPIPGMSATAALIKGMGAVPTMGFIIGLQMASQKGLERLSGRNNGGETKPSFLTMLASSAAVGLVSAPGLAVFNGLTLSRTAMQSLRSLSVKQTSAIVVRETTFLFSLRVSGPIGEVTKGIFGDNKGVEYGSAFMTGVVGSIAGHPADTALTLWQEGMKLTSVRQSMKGAPVRAVTVGAFSVIYRAVSNILS